MTITIDVEEGPATPTAMVGTDEVLPTRRLRLSTGNICDVTVGMKREPDGVNCRISVRYAWVGDPSAAEIAAVEQYMRSMGLGDPVFKTAPHGDETESDRTSREWLNQGRIPTRFRN